ncbi:nitrite reductase large subunit [Anaerobacillus alkalilacustris]|uniref:Nitrite reductase large subunit n=2 Tax=Anaerobacillus alkalilacustris TaxID=393763 RepID=A0A1S2LN16_9BACI|nr:nitrite reductase large subunit [Anaerobacillus alkalilacustris]
MMRKKLLVVGNGMAGVRSVEEIIKNNSDAFDITIFGKELHVNYNRILLSTVLQGDTTIEDIIINDQNWYEKNNIELFTNETVVKIDKEKKMIKTDQNREVGYDKLILATGSSPFMLPIPGAKKEGVIPFRTIEDCQKMIEYSKRYKKAVVIGGGLLGLEAARGLLNLGMTVHVVHLAPFLMERQLDETAAHLLQKELESQGMNFLLEKMTEEIIGDHHVQGLRFKDGTEIEAELVVMAVGVTPNIQLAKESGIETNRAIIVNDFLQTNIPDIYAVGECVEHRGMVYGLVKPLYEQGKVLAKSVCQNETEGYKGSVLSTQLKISGVDLFSVGQLNEDDTTKTIKVYDELEGIYKKIIFKGNKMIGAVMFGDTSDGSRILDMIIKQKDITDLENVQMFQPPNMTETQVEAMDSSNIICQCNSVSKGKIIEACQKNGITTIDEVKKCTKASGSCGSCKPLVQDLLNYIQSPDFDEVIEKIPFCGCTSLSEDEVVHQIQVQNLVSIEEVVKALDWKSESGCSTCRPALNYYLAMIYPTYVKKQDSLFLNENMNATLQSDGTFSVIPQMYGGVTDAKELRKIADVVEKYNIPSVTLTSGQRISLNGVKKEYLRDIWSDLDMRLCSRNEHTVQPVRTCMGENVCKCDKEVAIDLAIRIERSMEFIQTPNRVNMSISGCIHNGAEATTKDVGVVRIDRGWEIYVGGNSGRNVKAGNLLCVTENEEEVIKLISAFIQYYRETANYLETTGEWLDRIGLIHVREVLFDEELCIVLLTRLEMETSTQRKSLALKMI